MRVVPDQRLREPFGVRINQELVGIETKAALGLVRAMPAIAVELAGCVVLVAKDKAPPMSGPARHLGTTAIEACKPGEIIVVEQKSGVDAGSWGGILSLGAKLRGVAGVVYIVSFLTNRSDGGADESQGVLSVQEYV